MSDLYRLLRACIEQGAVTIFRSITQHLVLQDEQGPYQFVRNFLSQHGQLPSLLTLQQQGIVFPPIIEPASYYLQQVKLRYTYTLVSGDYPRLHTAMTTRNMPEVLAIMRSCISNASSSLSPNTYSSIEQATELVTTSFAEARAHIGVLRGVTLGYLSIDQILGGARGGDLIVVAGRPGMGKSWLMLNMANASWLSRRSVCFVTMEMSTEEIMTRWVGLHTGTNPELISRGELPFWAEQSMREKIAEMRHFGLAHPLNLLSGDFNKDTQGVESFILEHSPDILYIDAAYLLTATGRANGFVKKWESLSQVVAELKTFALRYNIPIVISVQFNRNVKNNQDKALDLGDIAGTDSIPQDATAVFGARLGLPPYERTQRYVECLKARRGSAKDFSINFGFSPLDFSETIQTAASAVDVNFMV